MAQAAPKILARWTVDDYHRMIAAGILQGRQVELLAGEVVEMSPEAPIHYNAARRGTRYLETLLANRAEVRFNGPITLANSEPEPDIAVVRPPDSRYDDRHPAPEDIFWLVEYAKTSLRRDLELKAPIYAAAEIPEYWIVDLTEPRLLCLTQPQGGRYRQPQVLTAGSVTPLAFPDMSVAVARLFA